MLSQGRITEEWLCELLQDGGARQLFIRKGASAPLLGDEVRLSAAKRNRFAVYSDDFAGQDRQLFLAEMNRSKRYAENSRLLFFREAFGWIVNNIIVINPSIGMLNAAVYYDNGSLERVRRLIETFDTGVTDIKERLISLEEMNRLVSAEVVQTIFAQLKAQMQMSDLSTIQTTWRAEGGFFNICIRGNLEPEISTIVLRHTGSSFDFSFADESDGTKRLFDLVDMLLKGRSDTVFVVDELVRSLHPKLTKHFLRLFMRAHDGDRTQLVFTTHEDAIMDQSLFS